jgi:hypothetical protein
VAVAATSIFIVPFAVYRIVLGAAVLWFAVK